LAIVIATVFVAVFVTGTFALAKNGGGFYKSERGFFGFFGQGSQVLVTVLCIFGAFRATKKKGEKKGYAWIGPSLGLLSGPLLCHRSRMRPSRTPWPPRTPRTPRTPGTHTLAHSRKKVERGRKGHAVL